MDYAQTLRAARSEAGLTQAELAAGAGTSQTAVSAYENGARTPSLETFERLLAACGSRLAVRNGARPVRHPSAAQLRRNGQVLLDVLGLAETLPVRHDSKLRYPRLSEVG